MLNKADDVTFAATARREWDLDPDFLTVNHGSYGATPRAVLAAQDAWRRHMEAQPTKFLARDYPKLLREAAAALAGFLGAAPDDLVFVDNATSGCNVVLRSLHLRPGEEIVVLSHGYGAVIKTVRYVTEGAGGRAVYARLPFPQPDDDAVVAALAGALGPRTRLAVLDHITSASALLLPVSRMIAACRNAGVPVLVDGAHAPGHVDLDLQALGADWYAGNCHKWLMAPKGCGFLWAARGRQQDLHPVTISHGYGQGFLAEFDWTGTRDPTAFLAVAAAIDFHARLGGPALQARNVELAAAAARHLSAALGTPTANGRAAGCAMASIRLPVAGRVTRERALALRARLLDAGTDAPVNEIDGGAWLRISAQAYNETADYERLGRIVSDLVLSDG